MKKFLLTAALFITFQASANAETLNLPQPDKTGGIPLMEAISKRQSVREFSAKEIGTQTLSDILYAAWGVSHDGKRTIPTALNKQDLQVFAFYKNAIWKYDGIKIDLISETDLTPALALQDYVKDAPLTLIYTGSDTKYSPMNAAAAYQNVGLYCASRGLNNVIRGYINRDEIAKALKLPANEIIVSQTIGWPFM